MGGRQAIAVVDGGIREHTTHLHTMLEPTQRSSRQVTALEGISWMYDIGHVRLETPHATVPEDSVRQDGSPEQASFGQQTGVKATVQTAGQVGPCHVTVRKETVSKG